jgi:hypothetical protein
MAKAPIMGAEKHSAMKFVASKAIENIWFFSMRHTAGPGVADSVLLNNGMCATGPHALQF